MWRAGCVETRTSGSEGGPGRRTELKSRHRALVRPYVAAAVFAVDEKPQIQALNRTAPTLPMLPTTPARATHDYVRHGTCVRIPVIANNDSGSKRTRFRSKPNRCRLAAPVVAVRLSSGPAGGQAT